MRSVTETEKKLALLLINNYDFARDEFIAIGLLCNSEEKAEKMISYITENPKVEFNTLLEEAVQIHKEC